MSNCARPDRIKKDIITPAVKPMELVQLDNCMEVKI
jgi:hypothetical protein